MTIEPLRRARLRLSQVKIIAQHFDGRHDEIAAVGGVQGAAADEGEIGHPVAHHRLFFDFPEQVVVRGVQFKHDGRAVGFGIVHEYVDLVAARNGTVSFYLPQGLFGFVFRFELDKLMQVFQNIRFEFVQKLFHRRVGRVFGGNFFQQVVERGGSDFVFQVEKRLVGLPFEYFHLPGSLPQVFFQGILLLQDTFLFLFAEFEEFFVGHGAPVHHRHGDQFQGRSLDNKFPFIRFSAQRLENAGFLVAEFLDHRFPFFAVFFTFEHFEQGRPGVGDVLVHVVSESAGLAFGQAEFAGLVGIGKVVHVAPVAGRRLLLGHIF